MSGRFLAARSLILTTRSVQKTLVRFPRRVRRVYGGTETCDEPVRDGVGCNDGVDRGLQWDIVRRPGVQASTLIPNT